MRLPVRHLVWAAALLTQALLSEGKGKDYYETLGLKKNAKEAAIKKAYRWVKCRWVWIVRVCACVKQITFEGKRYIKPAALRVVSPTINMEARSTRQSTRHNAQACSEFRLPVENRSE